MSTNQAFLQAILDAPEDDAPRLVYADWLDENGDADRAEFIRVQVELSRLPDDDDRRAELTARERQLFVAHARHWARGLDHFRFARGFVERLLLWEPDAFTAKAEAICQAHPIRDLWLVTQDGVGWGRRLAACPQLARLAALRMPGGRSDSFSASDLRAAVRSPHLTGLETLDVGGDNQIGDGDFADLIAAGRRKRFPAHARLRRLGAQDSHLTDRSVHALLDSPLAGTLTHLDLESNEEITPAGVRALWGSALWQRLGEASLGWLHCDDAPSYPDLVAALAHSRLVRLSLAGLACRARRGPAALAAALAAARSWGELRALKLSWLDLSGAGVRALAGCPHLANLRRLDLDSCNLNCEDVEALAGSPHARNLTALNLGSNPISDRALRALAASPYLTRLTYLNLGCAAITRRGVAALVESPNVAHLRLLNMNGCVSDASLQAIAASPHLARLTTLYINTADGVRDAGVIALARSPHLRCLSFLDLFARPTEKGQRALLEATHIAWPGLTDHNLKSKALRELYDTRFDHWYGYDITWDEPFFPWAKHA